MENYEIQKKLEEMLAMQERILKQVTILEDTISSMKNYIERLEEKS